MDKNILKTLKEELNTIFRVSDLKLLAKELEFPLPNVRRNYLKKDYIRSLADYLINQKRVGDKIFYKIKDRDILQEIHYAMLLTDAIHYENKYSDSKFIEITDKFPSDYSPKQARAGLNIIDLSREDRLKLSKKYKKGQKDPFDSFFKDEEKEFKKNKNVLKKAEKANKKQELFKLDDSAVIYEFMKEPMTELNSLVATAKINQTRIKSNLPPIEIGYNLVMKGPAGTGKNTCAEKFAYDLYSAGIVKSPQIVCLSSCDLKGKFLGQSAPKTKAVLEEHKGHVIYIDEFYSIMQDSDSYGYEVIAQLLITSEEIRNDTVIILAGYSNEMDQILETNPGLKSRFRNNVVFKNYDTEQLLKIFTRLLQKNKLHINYKFKDDFYEFIKKIKKDKHFGNAREIRNLFEQVIKNQSLRLSHTKENLSIITKDDLVKAIEKLGSDKGFNGITL